MNIVVCVKQVPDTTARKELGADFLLNRAELDAVINPFDEYALEEALRLRETHGGEVVVVSMGPARAEDALRRALAMGADRAILISDDGLRGSDWLATIRVLASVIARESYDLVLTGIESTDARTGVVPAGLAELLGVPAVTYAIKLEWSDGTTRVDRQVSGGYVGVTVQGPAVVSIVKGANDPRYPSLKGIMAAKRKEVRVLSLADVGLPADDVGLEGSRTPVTAASARPAKETGRVEHPESADDAARIIADFLTESKFI